MSAQLTSTSVIFGDSTTLSSKYGIVPQSSVMIFFQAAAPTGWTKLITQNDKALRVVSGSGGGSGGTTAFTTAFPNSLKTLSGSASITATNSGQTGNHTLTSAQIPIHAHPASTGSDGAHVHQYQRTDTQPNLNRFQGTLSRPAGNVGDVTLAENLHGHGITVSAEGGNGAHLHPWTFQSAPISTTIDLRVQYCDTISCSFD